jgi:exodeoxyribonuclease III
MALIPVAEVGFMPGLTVCTTVWHAANGRPVLGFQSSFQVYLVYNQDSPTVPRAIAMSSGLLPICRARFPSRGGREPSPQDTRSSPCARVDGRGIGMRCDPMQSGRILEDNVSQVEGCRPKVGLVTWNVNGLLPCLKRMGMKLLEELLESFGPDVHIICLQESKLQQSQLDQTLARPKGWDAFYSFANASQTQAKAGYSGTATFVRQESRPIDASKDLSSLCCLAEIPTLLWDLDLYGARTDLLQCEAGRKRSAYELYREDEPLSETCGVDDVNGGGLFRLLCETSAEELHLLDSEGRFLATDLGDFVLLNCYFPAMRSTDKFEFKADKDRVLFKMRFNVLVHQAVAKLHAQGRRVVLVGDLNISLNRIDTCDPDMSSQFDQSPSRAWLRSLLKDQSLEDVFRIFHPRDKQVYTCWNQQTGARLTNFGSRIDYILADSALTRAGGGPVVFSSCESQGHEGQHARGSDHCPVTAWLTLSSKTPRLPTDSWWASSPSSSHDREPATLCATFLPEVFS